MLVLRGHKSNRLSKTDLDKLGESTEDLANGFSKYADELKALTGFDIRVEGTTDTYKDLYDIFEGISAVWDKLSDTQQARVSEILGGTRQLQVVSSIVGNFGDAAGAYAAAMDSAGVATEANNIYMETAEAHINQMKAAFQALAQDFTSSDFIATGADIARGFIEAADATIKFVDALGGLKTVIAAIIALNAGSIATSIASGWAKALPTIAKLVNTLPAIVKAAFESNRANGATLFGGLFKAITKDANTLKATFASLGNGIKTWFTGLSAFSKLAMGFTGIITVMSLAKKAFDAYKAKIDETRKASMEAGTEAANSADAIKESFVAYENAKSAYDGSTESKQALQSATESLASALGVEKYAVDGLAESYRQLTVEQLKQKSADAKDGIRAAQKQLISGDNRSDTTNARISMEMQEIFGSARNTGTTAEKVERLRQVYQSLQAERMELIESGKEESRAYEMVVAALDELGPEITDLEEQEGNLASINEILAGALTGTLDGLNNVESAASKAKGSIADVFASEAISGSITEAKSTIDSLATSLTSLSDGTMGVEDVIDLLMQFPELSEYVDLSADGFGRLDEGLRKLINDAPTEVINTLKEFKNTHDLTDAQSKSIDDLCDALADMPTDKIGELSDNFGVLADNIRKANEAQSELEKKLSEDDYDAGYEGRRSAFEGFQETLDAGEYGSKAYAAYLEYFGLIGQTTDEVQQWAEANTKYFSEGKDGIVEWLNTVEALTQSGELDGIASFDWESGMFTYDVTKLDEFAEALGWTEEMLQDFIYKYRMYVDEWENYSPSDLNNMFTQAGLVGETDSGAIASMAKLMEYTGKTRAEVQQLIDEVNEFRQGNGDSQIKLFDDSFLQEIATNGIGSTVEDINSAMQGLSFTLKGIGVDWDAYVKGNFEDFDGMIRPALEALGWTDDMIEALHATLSDPFTIAFSTIGTDSIDAVIEKLHAYNIDVTVNDNGGLVITQGLVDNLQAATGNAQTTLSLLDQLQNRPDVTIEAGVEFEGKDLQSYFAEDTVTVNFDLNINDENVTVAVTTTAQKVTDILGAIPAATIDADTTSADEKIDALNALLSGVNNTDPNALVTVDGQTATVESAISRVSTALTNLNGRTATVTVNYQTTGIPPHATGTKHANKGPALLGDEYSPSGSPRPELVVSKGRAYLAGIHGPVIAPLEDGDVVYTYAQTKRILGQNRNIKSIPAFAGGKIDTSFRSGTSSSVSKYEAKATSTSDISVSTNIEEVSEELEEQLKKLQQEINEILERYDFKIFMAEKHEEDAATIIAIYKKMQEEVHAQAEKYRAMGVEEESEYIRDLQKKWWEYADAIKEARQSEFEDWMNDAEFSIDVLNHNGASADEIANSWKGIYDAVQNELNYYLSNGYDYGDEIVQDLLQKLWDAKEQIGAAREEMLNDWVDDQKFSIDEMLRGGNIDPEKIADVWKEIGDRAKAEYEKLLADGYDETDEVVQNVKELIWEASDSAVQAYADVAEAARSSLSDITSAFETLAKAQQEYNDTGYISIDTFQSLLSNGIQYLGMLTDENGQLVINADSVARLTQAKIENCAVTEAMSYLAQVQYAVENDEIGTLASLTQAVNNYTTAGWGAVSMTAQLIQTMMSLKGLDSSYAEGMFNVLNNLKSITSTVSAGVPDYVSNTISGGDSGGGGSETDERLKALQDVIKWTEDLIKFEHDQMVEALDDQLDKYKEIIDQKKKSLELTKSELSYNKKMSKQRTDIAKLQARINMLSLDDSREAMIERGKLMEELAELQEQMEEDQWDHAYDLQTKSLDKQADNFEDMIKKRQEEIKNEISSEQKLYDLAIDRIDNHWNELYDDLINWNYEYGNSLTSEITEAWGQAESALQQYGNTLAAIAAMDVSGGSSGGGGGYGYSVGSSNVNVDEQSPVGKAHTIASGVVNAFSKLNMFDTSTSTSGLSDADRSLVSKYVDLMKANSEAWHSADAIKRKMLSAENESLASMIADITGMDVRKDGNGVWWIGNDKLYDVYHKGGVVGGNSNEQFALLQKGEWVISKDMVQKLGNLIELGAFLKDKSETLANAFDHSVFGTNLSSVIGAIARPDVERANNTVIQVDASLSVSGVNDEEILGAIRRHPRAVAEEFARVLI